MSASTPLHPEAQALLERLRALGARPLDELGLQAAREAVRGSRALQGEPEPVHAVREHEVPGPAGMVTIRSYHPAADEALPLVVYLHGGGWATGGLDEADAPCRVLARDWQCVVVSVDYRLSPETPYPGAVEDVLAVLGWLDEHTNDLRASGSPLLVGESAGGTLAASAALRLAGRGTPLRGLVLFYPPLRHRPPTPRPPARAFTNTLSQGEMEWFWQMYLGSRTSTGDPGATPLDVADLSGLPPTVLVTAAADILRPEGEEFAHRLQAAGVTARHLDVPGMVHGFLGMLGALPSARTTLKNLRHMAFDQHSC